MEYRSPHIQDARWLVPNRVVLLVKDLQGGLHELEVKANDFYDYQNGSFIQNCFPYLSMEERELMISGFTPEMWDSVFSDEEN